MRICGARKTFYPGETQLGDNEEGESFLYG